MASQEHLDLLKQGVEIWNQWRQKHPEIRPDFDEANLEGIHLGRADLSGASFRRAYLFRTLLDESNLYDANLQGADLHSASLIKANLSRAALHRAYLHGANLDEANLTGADLVLTDLSETSLNETDLSQTTMWSTRLADVDLSRVKGLDTVVHEGPSTIGLDTIYRSKGNIPEAFLQGTGVPKTFFAYIPSLINLSTQYYTCFISYSSRDEAFAMRLHADLQSNGVRCWFAPEDLKIGAKIRPSIDESIHLYDKLLLALSQHSVSSQWVEQEVETALAKERKEGRIVLFPIRLDKAVMEIEGGWPALIRNTRNIGDFTRWKRLDAYQKALDRLLRDLKAEA
jgi:hypothetical protein